jgi:hypothetical protein
LGVSYLHSRGIAHGGAWYYVSFRPPSLFKPSCIVDLHLDNFGCTLPGLNEHSEWDVMAHFGNPDCVPILAVNPMNQTASIPPYIVSAISMADYLAKSRPPLPIESYPPSLKLDFGNCTFLRYVTDCMLTFFQHISRAKCGHLPNLRSKYALLKLYFA